MIKLITLSFLSGLCVLAQAPVGRVVACTDAGANDTYTCTPSPAISSYTTGLRVQLYANTANTGAATVNINALGAKTIKKLAGAITTDLSDNDIRAGQYVDLVYDGTNFQMLSQLGAAASNGGGISAWASTTAYTTGQMVYTTLTPNSTAYYAIWRAGANCTSGASFDATEVSNCSWSVVSGNSLVENYITASGSPFTWNKPLGAKTVRVICIGSGAGGGSGARRATSSVRTGGAGGGAGGRSEAEFDAASIGSTVTITIGAGGTGGAARTSDDTNGASGGNGNASSFGSYLRANPSVSAGGAAGSTTSPVAAGTGGSGLFSSGANGGTGTSSTGSNGATQNFVSSGGGGGGGAAGSSTTAAAGGTGGGSPSYANSLVTAGTAGTTGGVAAGQGTCNDEAMVCAGSGGGYYITATAGGTGAAGLKYGAGGGGGGASDNGSNSGAGGDGAPGACRIITRF